MTAARVFSISPLGKGRWPRVSLWSHPEAAERVVFPTVCWVNGDRLPDASEVRSSRAISFRWWRWSLTILWRARGQRRAVA